MAVQGATRYSHEFPENSPYLLLPGMVRQINGRHSEQYLYNNEHPAAEAANVIIAFLRSHPDLVATFPLENLAERVAQNRYLTINGRAVSLSDSHAKEDVALDYTDQYFSGELLEDPVKCPHNHFFNQSRAVVWAQKTNNTCPVNEDHSIGHLQIDVQRRADVLYLVRKDQIVDQMEQTQAQGEFQQREMASLAIQNRSAALFGGKAALKVGATAVSVVAKKSIKKGTEKAAQKAAQKAVETIAKEVASKAAELTFEQAAQAAGKKIIQELSQEVSQKVATTIANKAVEKIVEKGGQELSGHAVKKIAKEGVKTAQAGAKQIPFVSLAFGVGFAAYRVYNGQYGRAGGELLSGVLGCFPGYGTIASIAVDAGLIGYDIHEACQAALPKEPPEWYASLGITYDENAPPSKETVDRAYRSVCPKLHEDKALDLSDYHYKKKDEMFNYFTDCRNKIYAHRGWQ
jgi:hypothetical protein